MRLCRPKCWDVENLVKMLDAGMTVARLNFSHGDHKMHGETVEKLRAAFKMRKDLPCAIMLDTKGPEIRTGLLVDHKNIDLVANQELEISIPFIIQSSHIILATDYAFPGTSKKIACSYKELPR